MSKTQSEGMGGKRKRSSGAEYERVVAAASREYERWKAKVDAEYERLMAPIEDEYQRVKAQNEAERKQLLAGPGKIQAETSRGLEIVFSRGTVTGEAAVRVNRLKLHDQAPCRVKNRWLSCSGRGGRARFKDDGHFVPGSAVEDSSRRLLVEAAPLFEKERLHRAFDIRFGGRKPTPCIYWPRAPCPASPHNSPVDSLQ